MLGRIAQRTLTNTATKSLKTTSNGMKKPASRDFDKNAKMFENALRQNARKSQKSEKFQFFQKIIKHWRFDALCDKDSLWINVQYAK